MQGHLVKLPVVIVILMISIILLLVLSKRLIDYLIDNSDGAYLGNPDELLKR